MTNASGKVRYDALSQVGPRAPRTQARLVAQRLSQKRGGYFYVVDGDGEILFAYHRGKSYAGWRASHDVSRRPRRH